MEAGKSKISQLKKENSVEPEPMSPKDFARSIVTIGKDVLATLPAAEYKGEIKLIDKAEKVKAAIMDLRNAPIIGFDTETRPSFRKGQQYNVSLIQLASPERCYLFRTNEIGYPSDLISLLEDPEKVKVGLSIHDDFHNLKRVTEVEPQGFVDLQCFVKDYKIADNSLSRVYGILFGERISKGQRLTNWEATELSEAQQCYAALDAYACIRIYNYLKEGKFDPLKSPYLTLPPEPSQEDLEICSNEPSQV